METSTNTVVENRLEPIQKSVSQQQLVVTGQGLYSVFFTEAEAQSATRMDLIKSLVPIADHVQVAGATDEMVKLARKADLANGVPEKDENDKRTRGPKEASAMNVRTNVRNIWGAMKAGCIGLDDLGYQECSVAARMALQQARLIWTGMAMPTEATKAAKKALKSQKVELATLAEVRNSNPRLKDETGAQWDERTRVLAEKAMEQTAIAMAKEEAMKAYEQVVGKLSEQALYGLTLMLCESFSIPVPKKSEEMTDEAAEALLAAHTEEMEVENA